MNSTSIGGLVLILFLFLLVFIGFPLLLLVVINQLASGTSFQIEYTLDNYFAALVLLLIFRLRRGK